MDELLPFQTDMAVLARGIVLHAAPHQALQLVSGVMAATGRATAQQTADPRWLIDGGRPVVGLEATPTGCVLTVHELAVVGSEPQGAEVWEWIRSNVETVATASGVRTTRRDQRFVQAQVIDPSTSLWSAAPAQPSFPGPTGPPGQPPQQTWPTPAHAPPPARSTGVKVAVAVVGVVAGLMVLGILAAIAIPVFLDQRQKAELAEFSSLTCEDVGTSAVELSAQEAGKDLIPLVEVTDAVVVADERATLQVPHEGSRSFVMTCDGTGLWGDGIETPVTVDVYVDSELTPILEVAWDE